MWHWRSIGAGNILVTRDCVRRLQVGAVDELVDVAAGATRIMSTGVGGFAPKLPLAVGQRVYLVESFLF